ncbi:hypothetical protein NOCA2120009 [metagenome]|uniref:Uncharacterized protein n=1 Tax=metagenome TaxID=256318 RepID=A0A2P2BW56_9ZZZZ
MIRLIIGNHQVTAVADAQSHSEPYDATPDSLWRAALAAARATTGLAPYDATALEITTDTGLVAIWDVETLGSPSALLSASEVAGLRDTAPHLWVLMEAGRYAVGTLESYLVARLTRGTWHLTTSTRPLTAPDASRPEAISPGDTPARTEPSVFLGLEVAIRLG